MKIVKIFSVFFIVSAVFALFMIQTSADDTAAQTAIRNANKAVLSGDIETVVKLCKEIIDKYPDAQEVTEAKKKLGFIEDHSDYSFEPLRRLFKTNKLVQEGHSAKSQDRPYREYYNAALKGYQDIIVDYPNCSLVPQLHTSVAGIYRELGDCEKAVAILKKLMEKYPTDEHAKWAQWMMAQIYNYDLSNYEQALIEYEKYIERYPKAENIDLVKSSIQSIYVNQGKDDLYESTLMAEINKAPDSKRSGGYYLTMADYFYRKKNYDKAIPIYEKVEPFAKVRLCMTQTSPFCFNLSN